MFPNAHTACTEKQDHEELRETDRENQHPRQREGQKAIHRQTDRQRQRLSKRHIHTAQKDKQRQTDKQTFTQTVLFISAIEQMLVKDRIQDSSLDQDMCLPVPLIDHTQHDDAAGTVATSQLRGSPILILRSGYWTVWSFTCSPHVCVGFHYVLWFPPKNILVGGLFMINHSRREWVYACMHAQCFS